MEVKRHEVKEILYILREMNEYRKTLDKLIIEMQKTITKIKEDQTSLEVKVKSLEDDIKTLNKSVENNAESIEESNQLNELIGLMLIKFLQHGFNAVKKAEVIEDDRKDGEHKRELDSGEPERAGVRGSDEQPSGEQRQRVGEGSQEPQEPVGEVSRTDDDTSG